MVRLIIFTLLGSLTAGLALMNTASAQVDFRRGDADGDGVVGTISDVNFLNRALIPFPGVTPFVECRDAADANDDGAWNVADSIFLLETITGTAIVPPPGLTCGPDPTDDPLDCLSYSCTPTPLPQISTATLGLESEFGAVGDFLTVHLFLDTTAPETDLPVGFSASVQHDPSVATVISVDVMEQLPSSEQPSFRHSSIEPGGFSVAALDFFGQPLPNLLAVITYELIGPGTTALTFGDLPLRTEVTAASGDGGFPLEIEGAIGVHEFKRGDANEDLTVDIGDAITVLGTLFLGNPESPCVDAADANDDGAIDLGDPITILNFLIGGGVLPPAPGPFSCGPDPTPDALRCLETICP